MWCVKFKVGFIQNRFIFKLVSAIGHTIAEYIEIISVEKN